MSVRVTLRSDSARGQALTPPGPEAAASSGGASTGHAHVGSLSKVHTIIGTLAGIASIAGVAFSLVPTGRAATAPHAASTPNTGNLVAIVKAAGGRQGVPDATIEILTTQNAIVATLTPDATGRASQELREGVYVVRISHPRYAAEVRRVQVVPRQTVEVRASLRAGSSSPTNHTVNVDHALNGTVNAVRRALRF